MEIKFEQVGHTYQKGTSMAFEALSDINLNFTSGKFYAIIGHTGSGKSTLIQHINALLKPTEGVVTIGDMKVEPKIKTKNLKAVRKKIGLVFQFPEHQLFEETILKDIMFGPINFEIDEETAKDRAYKMLDVVGLDKSYAEKSPFDLSGGQMRRVAIAGVLAIEPDVLILDEPTAGLDPKGQKEMMKLFKKLNKEYNKTIILITHDMNNVNDYCDEVIVMNKQKVYKTGSVCEVFSDYDSLKNVGLDTSYVQQISREISEKLGVEINYSSTLDELVLEVKKVLNA